ncbi:hypothetical protein SDIAM26S_05021 [Streptomyces diastaticus subsp. diastaticus]
MLEDLVEEEGGGEPLALEASLHVGEGQDHRVDLSGADQAAQLLDGERGCAVYHGNSSFVTEGHKVWGATIDWEGGTAG